MERFRDDAAAVRSGDNTTEYRFGRCREAPIFITAKRRGDPVYATSAGIFGGLLKGAGRRGHYSLAPAADVRAKQKRKGAAAERRRLYTEGSVAMDSYFR